MKRLLHLPSGITRGIAFLVSQDWSAEQALAVLELLDDLRECIAAHYQIPLHELLHEQRAPPDNPHPHNIEDPF